MGGDASIGPRPGTGAPGSIPARARSGRSAGRVGEREAGVPPLDRRHDSERAVHRRRVAEDALLDALLLPPDAYSASALGPVGGDALATAPGRFGSEGQALLMRSLQRLARQEDVGGSVAWSLGPEGEPRVLGAQPTDHAERVRLDVDTYAALARLERPQRLTDDGLEPVLAALADQDVAAAAPVAGFGAAPSAVLLVFPMRSGRPLRPRSVAVLAEVVERLGRSLPTSLAADRIADLDDAVQRLDRLAALGGLVSEIVHEIRNPLVSVKTFLQLLPDRLSDPEFHGDFRQLVGDEVARLERMLDDLLRHARPSHQLTIEEGSRIDEAIETTLQLLTYRSREKGVTLESAIREELPALALSRDGLRQILMNLLINAIGVTPQGGRVVIRADWSEQTANHVLLVVEDEGPGIADAIRDHVFEPFWTTRGEGVGGLGLAICKRIVEQAGGTIALETYADETGSSGARMSVELPIVAA